MFLLVISAILSIFVNILTADHKYSLPSRKNLKQSIQMQLSKKQETFFGILCFIYEMYSKFWTFWEKPCSSQAVYFRNYGLAKTWLDKCLKGPVSEHRSTVNMLKGSIHCWNLHDIAFIRSAHHSERSTLWKCLSYWYVKS